MDAKSCYVRLPVEFGDGYHCFAEW